MKSAIAIVIVVMLAGTPGFAEGANLGDSGQNGTAETPWVISSLADFHSFCSNSVYWDGHTRLDSDLDLSSAGTYSQAPIAGDTDTDSSFDGTAFSGTFNGNGHTISNMKINGPHYCGLFGKLAAGAEVRNLGLENISITSTRDIVGGLVGTNEGTISDCYLTGAVKGDFYVGGLAGKNNGNIYASYSTGSVEGDDYIGGLNGWNEGVVMKCYSTAAVNGENYVGGLAGQNNYDIHRCYSTGTVTGEDNVGGLIGYNFAGSTLSCYFSGAVTGDSNIGGLVGNNNSHIAFCYSIGEIVGRYAVGGFVGYINNGSSYCCYSAGSVIADSNIGGFAGKKNLGYVTYCFWDIETYGIGESGDLNHDAIGKTTSQMQDIDTFLNVYWDFDPYDGDLEDWVMPDDGYPKLFWQKSCMYILIGDLNQDCKIDLADLAIMASNWMVDCIKDSPSSDCRPY